MKKFFFLFLFFLSVNIYAELWRPRKPNYSDYLKTWIGKNVDELLLCWGNPSSLSQLSDGQTLMQYDKHVQETTKGSYTPGSVTTTSSVDKKGNVYITQTVKDGYFSPPVTYNYEAFVLFIFNNQNKITGYSYDGQTGALNKMITQRRCPYYSDNTFYLARYQEKAQEWIGYTIDDFFEVFSSKKKYNEILIDSRKAFVVTSPEDDNSYIIFRLDDTGNSIENVEVAGAYKILSGIYKSPLKILLDELNTHLYLGANIGTVHGISIEPKIDLFNKFKLSSGVNVFFRKDEQYLEKNIFTGNLSITPLDYYVVDKEKFKFHVGAGVQLGFYSKKKIDVTDFSFGEDLFTAIQWGPVDIRLNYCVANYNPIAFGFELRLSYVYKPDLYKLHSNL